VILFLPERWLPRVMLGLVFAAPVTRYVTFAATHKGLLAVLTLPGSVDTLSIGAWLAWRWRLGAPPTSDGVGLIGVISYVTLQAVAALAENPLLPLVLSNTTTALAGLWIVDHVAREGLGTRWLRFRPLAFVGMISYSVYLIHDFLPSLLVFAFPSSPVWFAAGGSAQWMIIAGLSIAWAAASWFLLERPLNSLKHRVSL